MYIEILKVVFTNLVQIGNQLELYFELILISEGKSSEMVDIFPFVVERKAVYLQNLRFCVGELRVEVESVISIITRELEEYVKILSICPKYYRSERRFDLQVFQFDPVNCLEELVGLDILFLPRITAESLLRINLKESL